MFPKETYITRRKKITESVKEGIAFFPGHKESPCNYTNNTYKFRQDSSFLYFFGLNEPDIAAVIDLDSGEELIFGDERTLDDVIWMGQDIPFRDKCRNTGITKIKPYKELADYFETVKSQKRKIHFLPQYRIESKLLLEELLGIKYSEINDRASDPLIDITATLRAHKSEEEVFEIEKALSVSREMYLTAMKIARPGVSEQEVFGVIQGIANSKASGTSFTTIFSVRGETLHNVKYSNIMQDGQLALMDSGVETFSGYASDITRTFPVNGKFSDKQKTIYGVVLDAQLSAIKLIKPGILFRDVHLKTAGIIAEGLKEAGLMKGNVSDAVVEGAHALFFPHGLGHMLGLDVHDMEGIGENYIGYNNKIKRSPQFGLSYLRFARELEPGFVMTVEPGIYFIPELINQWKKENKHTEFINYSKLEKYFGFGGIRIEDDVLVTRNSCRVLGKPIPKTIDEIEEACK